MELADKRHRHCRLLFERLGVQDLGEDAENLDYQSLKPGDKLERTWTKKSMSHAVKLLGKMSGERVISSSL